MFQCCLASHWSVRQLTYFRKGAIKQWYVLVWVRTSEIRVIVDLHDIA